MGYWQRWDLKKQHLWVLVKETVNIVIVNYNYTVHSFSWFARLIWQPSQIFRLVHGLTSQSFNGSVHWLVHRLTSQYVRERTNQWVRYSVSMSVAQTVSHSMRIWDTDSLMVGLQGLSALVILLFPGPGWPEVESLENPRHPTSILQWS